MLRLRCGKRPQMSVKSFLRGILPPTNRNFEEKMSKLDNDLGNMMSEIRDLEHRMESLREGLDLVSSALSALDGRAASLDEKMSYIEWRHRYCNGEYSGLLTGDGGKILLAGWYGADNFGDELMLRTVIESFPRGSLDRIYVLLWDNPRYDRWGLNPAVHVIHYPNSIWDLEILSDRFDAVVWGGGAILDDKQLDSNPGNINTGNLFIRLNELMIGKGKKVFALGLSANDKLEDEDYIRRLSAIIDSSELFSLRDPYSLQTLVDAGVNAGQVVLCEDLAFSNQGLRALRASYAPVPEKRLGVVLLCVEDQFAHNLELLRSLLENDRLRDEGYVISLIPFLDENGWDILHFRRLKESLPDCERVVIERCSRNIEDTPIASCSRLISYKYHAALIADVLGIPNLSVYCNSHPHYKNKMMHLADLADVRSSLMSSSDVGERLNVMLEALLDMRYVPNIPIEMMEHECESLKETCLAISSR